MTVRTDLLDTVQWHRLAFDGYWNHLIDDDWSGLLFAAFRAGQIQASVFTSHWDDDGSRRTPWDNFAALGRAVGADAVVLVQDTFIAPDAAYGRPSQHPAAKEAVVVITLFADGSGLTRYAPYGRDDAGQLRLWRDRPENYRIVGADALPRTGDMPIIMQALRAALGRAGAARDWRTARNVAKAMRRYDPGALVQLGEDAAISQGVVAMRLGRR